MSIMLNNKFCKVCYDANKNVQEYTSHYVKDKPGNDGKIVCPLLLSQKCLFCNEYGHTKKYCKSKINENKKIFTSPPKIIFDDDSNDDSNVCNNNSNDYYDDYDICHDDFDDFNNKKYNNEGYNTVDKYNENSYNNLNDNIDTFDINRNTYNLKKSNKNNYIEQNNPFALLEEITLKEELEMKKREEEEEKKRKEDFERQIQEKIIAKRWSTIAAKPPIEVTIENDKNNLYNHVNNRIFYNKFKNNNVEDNKYNIKNISNNTNKNYKSILIREEKVIEEKIKEDKLENRNRFESLRTIGNKLFKSKEKDIRKEDDKNKKINYFKNNQVTKFNFKQLGIEFGLNHNKESSYSFNVPY